MEIELKPINYTVECVQCGDCCTKYGSKPLIPFEALNISKELDLPINTFAQFQTAGMFSREKSGVTLRNKKSKDYSTKCHFLEKDNECTIQKLKPFTCETYPYTIGIGAEFDEIGNITKIIGAPRLEMYLTYDENSKEVPELSDCNGKVKEGSPEIVTERDIEIMLKNSAAKYITPPRRAIADYAYDLNESLESLETIEQAIEILEADGRKARFHFELRTEGRPIHACAHHCH